MSLIPLTTVEKSRIELFFDSEERIGYAAAHGFLLAISVGPEVAVEEWMQWLLDDHAPDRTAEIEALIGRWQKELFWTCYHDEPLVFPCRLTPEDPLLNEWCAGFMEAVFCQEVRFFGENAEVVELTVPMVFFSNLDDSPEFKLLQKNRLAVRQMAENIPELIKELFLLFHPGD